jgi:hypothetical protein
MSNILTSNEHFLKRARNIRNELLNRTDRYMLEDYPTLTPEQLKIAQNLENERVRGDDSKSKFREEHLDWSDKLEHYRNGTYTRTYPEYSYELIQTPITVESNVYYPVLLAILLR